MNLRILVAFAAVALSNSPAQAAKPKDLWTRKGEPLIGEYGMEHRDGLWLYCMKQGGLIRVTLPGVIAAPLNVTAGTAKTALLEPGSDATHTRGVLMADNAVIPAIMHAGVFTVGGKTWKLQSEKDKRDVGLFFRACKAA